jgi:hypothetical protein
VRHITTFGLVTLAVGVLAAGCGDDDEGRLLGTSGSGGAAGTGNTGGAGGSAGVGTGGGGRGGMGGGTAVPASCAQCVELNVAISADPTVSRQAQFLFRPAALADMSNTTITWRVKVVTPTTEIPAEAMYVAPFAQNGEPLGYAGAYDPQTALTAANGFTSADTWVEIEQDIAGFGVTPPAGADAGDAGDGVLDAGAEGDAAAAPAGGFDKTQVFQYGLYVGATAAFTGTGTVRVALDSVTFSDPAFTDVTFTAGAENFQLDGYLLPPGSTLVFRP